MKYFLIRILLIVVFGSVSTILIGQVPATFYHNWESIAQETTSRSGLADTLIANGPKILLEEYDLFEFSNLTADSEGNVAGYDYGLSKIVYFPGFDLTDVKLIGDGKGKGPREFETPQDLKFDDKGNLWLSDVGSSRITQWSSQGELISTIPPSDRFLVPARIAVCSDKELFVLSNQYGGKGTIHYFNSNGQKTNSFQEIEDPMQRYPAYMEGEVSCNKGNFYMAGRFKNYIRKYDSDGTMLFSRSVVAFEPNEEPMVKREGRWTLRDKNARRASGTVSVFNDTLYVGFSGKKDGWQYIMDAYDATTGDYLRSYAFRTPVGDFHVVDEATIFVEEYNFETESTQLAVYGLPK